MSNNHYVNNADFLAAIIEYRDKVKKAEELGEEKPRIPDYIGECILKIGTGLSYKPNFINYSYKDEMILDGVENCFQYIHNFDPEKSKNPFSYFTQIMYYAFIRRITKEKKQTKIKAAMLREMPFDVFDLQGHDESGEFVNSYVEFLRSHIDVDIEPDIKPEKVKQKNSSVSDLNDFLGDL